MRLGLKIVLSRGRFKRGPRSVLCRRCSHGAGHLLSEFLVSMGILFLLMLANVAVLSSAADWANSSSQNRQALVVAREGMEQAIAAERAEDFPELQRAFTFPGSRPGTVLVLSRTITVEPLGEHENFSLVQVNVSWSDDHPPVVLERYVRKH